MTLLGDDAGTVRIDCDCLRSALGSEMAATIACRVEESLVEYSASRRPVGT